MTRRRTTDPPPPTPGPAPDMPELPPTDPVRRAIHLLEYARRQDFRIGPTLIVGDVRIEVEDIRQALRTERHRVVEDRGPYAEAGVFDEPAEGTGG